MSTIPRIRTQTNCPLEGSAVGDAQLVDALSGLDAQADQAVVQRTRRAVMDAAHQDGSRRSSPPPSGMARSVAVVGARCAAHARHLERG